jgi:hypothetical protein
VQAFDIACQHAGDVGAHLRQAIAHDRLKGLAKPPFATDIHRSSIGRLWNAKISV